MTKRSRSDEAPNRTAAEQGQPKLTGAILVFKAEFHPCRVPVPSTNRYRESEKGL